MADLACYRSSQQLCYLGPGQVSPELYGSSVQQLGNHHQTRSV
jgi:hypothetical protein